MTESAVHRTADPPVPVEVDDSGGIWPGQVLGWRGERVYVTYSEGPGLNHLTWLKASAVRRVSDVLQLGADAEVAVGSDDSDDAPGW